MPARSGKPQPDPDGRRQALPEKAPIGRLIKEVGAPGGAAGIQIAWPDRSIRHFQDFP